ncbi:MAG: enoyl-CoA hydratase [Armatimonadetes bacterium RBG_16_67_12]|nr:MAG: enoyl-CoA hydratase [Armatimonadetes bacterium RBG_16_67_12]
MAYTNILVEQDGAVAVVTLNRPKVLNALNQATMDEVVDALETLERDEAVRCVVLTGGERAFAAGADINEMAAATPVEMLSGYRFQQWERIRKIGTPIIAAVQGFALGGGCELAMLCDMIVAGEGARFGQPEINLGIIPGAGGTQRLTRAVGKARAMELILTGRHMTAAEAYGMGLVTRVVPDEVVVEEAKKLARQIAEKAPVAVRLAKEAILKAFDTTLEVGLDYERKLFYLLFSTEDHTEGIQAFLGKRPAVFKGR